MFSITILRLRLTNRLVIANFRSLCSFSFEKNRNLSKWSTLIYKSNDLMKKNMCSNTRDTQPLVGQPPKQVEVATEVETKKPYSNLRTFSKESLMLAGFRKEDQARLIEYMKLREPKIALIPRDVYGYVLGFPEMPSKPETLEYSISDFSIFTMKGVKYVDKTRFIKTLVKERRAIFLRPRRFGKSLTLSMLKSFWNGHTDLFRNCDVYKEEIPSPLLNNFVWSPSNPSTHNFPPCPVIHLDFSQYDPQLSFKENISLKLSYIAKRYGVHNTSSSMDLEPLLSSLCQLPWNEWGRCVLLIDEYDSPLHVSHPSEEKEILEAMATFFRVIKGADSNIAYAYVTGISSYGLAGLYSGANNFTNLSLNPELDALCGFTSEEVVRFLGKHSDTDNAEMEALRKAYYGYTWNIKATEATTRVYNPYEIVWYAKEKVIAPYFCSSSQEPLWNRYPELISLKLPIFVPQDDLYKPTSVVSATKIMRDNDDESVGVRLARLLLEAGYVTIKNRCKDSNLLTLDYPNELVANFVKSQIFKQLISKSDVFELALKFLTENDFSSLIASANVTRKLMSPRQHQTYIKESGYHVLLAQLLMMIGAHFAMEEGSAMGYSDLLAVTSKNIYVIELKIVGQTKKLNQENILKLCEVGLEQIAARQYIPNSDVIRDLLSKGRRLDEVIEVGLVASEYKFEAYSYRPYGSTEVPTIVML